MEIITYVRDGAISHEDSIGNEGRTEAGDVQVMSAGEASATPNTIASPRPRASSRSGSSPTARAASPIGERSRSRRAAAPGSSRCWRAASKRIDEALPIRAEARVLGATLRPARARLRAGRGRHLYLVPASGAVEVNGVRLKARDGAAIAEESAITITALADSELIMVDAA